MKKRGSLELSINAIVIVILAMTLLGLGLAFIQNMFSDISDTTSAVTEQVRNQILDDLRRSDKKLSFPTTDFQIEKGDAKAVAIGVKNTQPSGDLDFYVYISVPSCQIAGGAGTQTPCPDAEKKIDFFIDTSIHKLKITESDVYPVRITAKGDKGVYQNKIVVCTENNPSCSSAKIYAEKTFFITVI